MTIETEDRAEAGTLVAQLTAYADGVVTPGPDQTWDDVPEQPTDTKEDD